MEEVWLTISVQILLINSPTTITSSASPEPMKSQWKAINWPMTVELQQSFQLQTTATDVETKAQ